MDKTEEAENVAQPINEPSVYLANVRLSSSDYRTNISWRTMHRAVEGLETLSESNHIHRSRYARYWNGQNKDCHRWWQSKSNSTTRCEVRFIEVANDPLCGPESVTAYKLRHPERCVSSTTACEHTEAVFAKSMSKHGIKCERRLLHQIYLARTEAGRVFRSPVGVARVVTTISSNLPRSKYGRQCKTESLENNGNGQSQRGDQCEMYNVPWNVLVRNFGKSQLVVNARLKRIYSFPPMKPYDGAALIKFARIVSSCVILLTQFKYVGELNSGGFLGSATRKSTLGMKTKSLTHVKQMNLYQPGFAMFSEWINDIADVQEELFLSSNPNSDRAKSSYN